jgi:hypothetical protein
MRSRVCLLASLVGFTLLSGCNGPTMAPVRGRVTFKGKPVKEAAVVFSPVGKSADDNEPGKPATGFSDADGGYVLSTYKPLDGALVGKHRVTVSLDFSNPIRCSRRTTVTLDVKPGDNELDIELTP